MVAALLFADDTSTPKDPLTITESIILSSLRRLGSTRIDLLENRCGLERSALRNGALKRLRDWNLLETGPGGRVALCTPKSSARIIAIEAKLTKWKDALEQAVAYQLYADETYVLLPEKENFPTTKAEDKFRRVGVGLWFASTKRIVPVFPAAPSSEHNWRREFVYSRLLASQSTSNGD